jgi:hypothetical protein
VDIEHLRDGRLGDVKLEGAVAHPDRLALAAQLGGRAGRASELDRARGQLVIEARLRTRPAGYREHDERSGFEEDSMRIR